MNKKSNIFVDSIEKYCFFSSFTNGTTAVCVAPQLIIPLIAQ